MAKELRKEVAEEAKVEVKAVEVPVEKKIVDSTYVVVEGPSA